MSRVTTQFTYFSPLLDAFVTAPPLLVASNLYHKYGHDYERFIDFCRYIQAHFLDYSKLTTRTIHTESTHVCSFDILYENRVLFSMPKIDFFDRDFFIDLITSAFYYDNHHCDLKLF